MVRRKLLASLAGALYLAAFVVAGCETVAHTDGDLRATIFCGPVIGIAAAALLAAIAYFATLAVSGWWGWVRKG